MNLSIVMFWPILLAAFSDIFYQICAKSMPATLDPLAGLPITYMVGAVVSAILYFVLNKGGDIIAEWAKVNWTSFILGVAIVGLEVGSMYIYKVGWPVNTGYMVKSIILAIALIAVGYFIYKENFSLTKAAGIAVCLFGLYLLNK